MKVEIEESKLAEMRASLEAGARRLNRSVEVEEALADLALGKRTISPKEARALARKLGIDELDPAMVREASRMHRTRTQWVVLFFTPVSGAFHACPTFWDVTPENITELEAERWANATYANQGQNFRLVPMCAVKERKGTPA